MAEGTCLSFPNPTVALISVYERSAAPIKLRTCLAFALNTPRSATAIPDTSACPTTASVIHDNNGTDRSDARQRHSPSSAGQKGPLDVAEEAKPSNHKTHRTALRTVPQP